VLIWNAANHRDPAVVADPDRFNPDRWDASGVNWQFNHLSNGPGWEQGIRIGDAKTGWVTAFILDYGGDPRTLTGSGPEFVTVDKHGSVFGGEPRPRQLRKYVKVR
jgi:hypothetical protein